MSSEPEPEQAYADMDGCDGVVVTSMDDLRVDDTKKAMCLATDKLSDGCMMASRISSENSSPRGSYKLQGKCDRLGLQNQADTVPSTVEYFRSEQTSATSFHTIDDRSSTDRPIESSVRNLGELIQHDGVANKDRFKDRSISSLEWLRARSTDRRRTFSFSEGSALSLIRERLQMESTTKEGSAILSSSNTAEQYQDCNLEQATIQSTSSIEIGSTRSLEEQNDVGKCPSTGGLAAAARAAAARFENEHCQRLNTRTRIVGHAPDSKSRHREGLELRQSRRRLDLDQHRGMLPLPGRELPLSL